ncbi:hypothetical protein M0802_013610 [Mischocyttarus mexicanus]|nr:hypothetical protein M0802_013610 [Mischocyttarus mexicanus]
MEFRGKENLLSAERIDLRASVKGGQSKDKKMDKVVVMLVMVVVVVVVMVMVVMVMATTRNLRLSRHRLRDVTKHLFLSNFDRIIRTLPHASSLI